MLWDLPECPKHLSVPQLLFNFQDRMVRYEKDTGINLFERVFEALTTGQRERFAVDGSVQRSDSFQAMSNIADFGRLRLLVEVLRRLVRIFDDADNQRF